MAACVLLAGNEDQRYLFFFRLSEVNVRRAVVGATRVGDGIHLPSYQWLAGLGSPSLNGYRKRRNSTPRGFRVID